MKFECRTCIDEGIYDKACILEIKGAKDLKYDRDDWRKALRRCPFENYESGEYTGVSPEANWIKVKRK